MKYYSGSKALKVLFIFVLILSSSIKLNAEILKDSVFINNSKLILTASSQLISSGNDKNRYSIKNIMDNDSKTCWAEGSPGSGKNEKITIEFENAKEIMGFYCEPGYYKSLNHLIANACVNKFEVCYDNSLIDTFDLTFKTYDIDSENPEYDYDIRIKNISSNLRTFICPLNKNIITKKITIKIISVIDGQKYNDLCISELYPIFSDSKNEYVDHIKRIRRLSSFDCALYTKETPVITSSYSAMNTFFNKCLYEDFNQCAINSDSLADTLYSNSKYCSEYAKQLVSLPIRETTAFTVTKNQNETILWGRREFYFDDSGRYIHVGYTYKNNNPILYRIYLEFSDLPGYAW